MTSLLERLSIDPNMVCDCPNCGAHAVRVEVVLDAFPCGMGDPTIISAEIPVYTCDKCGFAFTDGHAETIIEEVIRAHLRERLPPSAIREIRRRNKLTRKEFAKLTGFGEASIKRWETGAGRQNAAADKFLRLLGDDPTLVEKLRHIERLMRR